MRVRSAVQVYAYFAVGISLVAIALRYWPGALHLEGQDQRLHSFHVDVLALIAGSAALVGGLATVLGLNLASENDGHLEIAWTKPVSREGYALGVFAVDIAAMVVCLFITVVCVAIVLDVYTGSQAVTFGPNPELLRVLAFCGAPLCVYGWIAALSASIKHNRGAVAGLFWPLMFVVALLHVVPIPVVHNVAAVLNLFNPIEIYSSSDSGPQPSPWSYAWGWALAVIMLTAAVLQWRRLQL
jgi:hypothetical protein